MLNNISHERRPFLRSQQVFRTLCVLALAAGGGSTVTDVPGPITPSDTTKPPTTVQRALITARVTIASSMRVWPSKRGSACWWLRHNVYHFTHRRLQSHGAGAPLRFRGLGPCQPLCLF